MIILTGAAFYYNYDELTPGPVVQETEEIIDYIRHLDARFDQAQVHALKKNLCHHVMAMQQIELWR